MTEFYKKRLEYFIKEADKYGWVRLAPGDKEIFQNLTIDTFDKASKLYWEGHHDGERHAKEKLEQAFDAGFAEGVQYVISGEMAKEEIEKDALKDTF